MQRLGVEILGVQPQHLDGGPGMVVVFDAGLEFFVADKYPAGRRRLRAARRQLCLVIDDTASAEWTGSPEGGLGGETRESGARRWAAVARVFKGRRVEVVQTRLIRWNEIAFRQRRHNCVSLATTGLAIVRVGRSGYHHEKTKDLRFDRASWRSASRAAASRFSRSGDPTREFGNIGDGLVRRWNGVPVVANGVKRILPHARVWELGLWRQDDRRIVRALRLQRPEIEESADCGRGESHNGRGGNP